MEARRFASIARPATTGSKHCTRCHRLLPMVAFSFNLRQLDSRNHWCRECIAAYQRDLRARHAHVSSCVDVGLGARILTDRNGKRLYRV